MRKARLGFKVLSLKDELLVEEDEDFERIETDKAYASWLKSKERKLRCYHKYRKEYNKSKRNALKAIPRRYREAKRRAVNAGQGWDLTQKQWQDIWIAAGFVRVPGTRSASNPSGVVKTAYALRGANRAHSTMMARKDTNKPWSKTNCHILYRNEPLKNSTYHEAKPQHRR